VAVAARRRLRDEVQPPRVLSGDLGVRLLVARSHDDADRIDASGQHFLDQDGEHRLLDAVAVDERLQGQGALLPPGRCDDSFLDLHRCFRLVYCMIPIS
jgi:hypothetical protein